MPVRQPCTVLTGTLGPDTKYLHIAADALLFADENKVSRRALAAMEAKGISVELTTAPGAGKSRTIALRVGGSDTTLLVTFTGSETTKALVSTVAIPEGARFNLVSRSADTPANTTARITLTFDYADPNVSGYGGGGQVPGSGGSVRVTGVFGVTSGWANVGNGFVKNLAPCPGRIIKVCVDSDVGPGTGETLDFECHLNGSAQGLSLSLADAETASPVLDVDIPFEAGDFLYSSVTPSGGQVESYPRISYLVELEEDGISILSSPGGSANLSADVTRYTPPQQYSLHAAEADSFVIGMLSGVVRDLHAVITTDAVSSADPVTLMVRKNGADTALAVTTPATPSFTTAAAPADLVDSVALTPADHWNLRIVTGSCFAPSFYWAAVLAASVDDPVIEPPPTPLIQGVIGPHLWIEFNRTQPGS